MSLSLDTSVLLASLRADEPAHARCADLIERGGHVVYQHALAEVFASLTGGSHGRRVAPEVALQLIEDSLLPYLRTVTLTEREMVKVFTEAQARGVRGGAVYDALHLAAARKAGSDTLLTLDLRDFQAIATAKDPAIAAP